MGVSVLIILWVCFCFFQQLFSCKKIVETSYFSALVTHFIVYYIVRSSRNSWLNDNNFQRSIFKVKLSMTIGRSVDESPFITYLFSCKPHKNLEPLVPGVICTYVFNSCCRHSVARKSYQGVQYSIYPAWNWLLRSVQILIFSFIRLSLEADFTIGTYEKARYLILTFLICIVNKIITTSLNGIPNWSGHLQHYPIIENSKQITNIVNYISFQVLITVIYKPTVIKRNPIPSSI